MKLTSEKNQSLKTNIPFNAMNLNENKSRVSGRKRMVGDYATIL